MNVDERERAKFDALAERWWDPNGEFKPLHDINGPRVEYIRKRCELVNHRLLDVGCGGGLLTEAMAGLGAEATGIDVSDKALAVAEAHAAQRDLEPRPTYVVASAETFLASHPGEFDIVTCLETLEHVPDPASTVAALAQLATAGGDIFLATINRTAKAFALAIVGAEYLLNILPKGTHRFDQLIRPAELAGACRRAGLQVRDIVGVSYNPFTRRCRFGADVAVNYMLHARKPAA